MKYITAIFVLLLIASAATAQTATKAKLIGKWKATAMDVDGHQITLASEAAIRKAFLTSGTNRTHEDTLDIYDRSIMIYDAFGNYNLDFMAGDSVRISVLTTREGKPVTETETYMYKLSGSKITISTILGAEAIDIKMTDGRSMIIAGLSDARGAVLTFTKQ